MNYEECESYADFGRLLGYNYYNASVKKKILSFCKERNIDIENIISNNKIKDIRKCLYCGKELKGKRKNQKKFCNSSCSASYNNKLRNGMSDESKLKISETLKKKFKDRLFIPHSKTCAICGNTYTPKMLSSGKFSKSTVYSDECHKKLKVQRGKEVSKQLIEECRHQGWKSRNIISYAERFWINVLEKNNIPYQREYHLDKKYFLDFFIEKDGKIIDLEIDGKQHKYEDRCAHDKIRDEYITNKGIIVYRIEWNEIQTDKGSSLMKEKINNFIDYYQKL